jgi:hypothetical protein
MSHDDKSKGEVTGQQGGYVNPPGSAGQVYAQLPEHATGEGVPGMYGTVTGQGGNENASRQSAPISGGNGFSPQQPGPYMGQPHFAAQVPGGVPYQGAPVGVHGQPVGMPAPVPYASPSAAPSGYMYGAAGTRGEAEFAASQRQSGQPSGYAANEPFGLQTNPSAISGYPASASYFQPQPQSQSQSGCGGETSGHSGTYPGGYPGSNPGGYPGGYPGSSPGGYPGAYPGGYPGAYLGGFPGAFPGGYPGGQPGAQPGTQTGGRPAYVPHAHHDCSGAKQTGQDAGKQYGELYGLIREAADGQPDISRFLNFFQSTSSDFWKGALVGTALTLLLTNDSVKSMLSRSVAGLWGLVGAEAEQREAEEDRKAAEQAAKEEQA